MSGLKINRGLLQNPPYVVGMMLRCRGSCAFVVRATQKIAFFSRKLLRGGEVWLPVCFNFPTYTKQVPVCLQAVVCFWNVSRWWHPSQTNPRNLSPLSADSIQYFLTILDNKVPKFSTRCHGSSYQNGIWQEACCKQNAVIEFLMAEEIVCWEYLQASEEYWWKFCC